MITFLDTARFQKATNSVPTRQTREFKATGTLKDGTCGFCFCAYMRSTHLGMVRRETLILKDGTYEIILFQRHFWAVYDYAGKRRISLFEGVY